MQDRSAEAIALAKDCLARSQEALGLEHIKTIEFQGRIARNLIYANQLAAASNNLTEALKTSSRVYPRCLDLKLSLQHTYILSICDIPENNEAAGSAYRDLISQYEEFEGGKNEVVLARRRYASLLCKLGNFQEAEELSRKNCKVRFGMNSPITWSVLEVLVFFF